MAYEFAGTTVPEGSAAWVDLDFAEDAEMQQHAVRARVVHGGDGPTLWLQGCLHGPEQVGSLAVRDFVAGLSPDDVAGTVVGVPVVNRMAFANKQRTAPIDHKDLNRSFPGSADGSYTDRLAHAVFSAAEGHADYLVDLHTGGNEFMIPGYSIYSATGDETESEARAMCDAADLPYAIAIPTDDLAGAMFAQLAARGVPSIILEAGGEGRLHEESVAAAGKAVRNVARHVGVVDGEPERDAGVSHHHGLTITTATTGGFFRASVAGNERVEAGQAIAEISDLEGTVVEVVEAPYDGVAVAVRTYAVARPGDWIFELTPE